LHEHLFVPFLHTATQRWASAAETSNPTGDFCCRMSDSCSDVMFVALHRLGANCDMRPEPAVYPSFPTLASVGPSWPHRSILPMLLTLRKDRPNHRGCPRTVEILTSITTDTLARPGASALGVGCAPSSMSC
jgi:hypothetical protein